MKIKATCKADIFIDLENIKKFDDICPPAISIDDSNELILEKIESIDIERIDVIKIINVDDVK
jgi:hypothetical protein